MVDLAISIFKIILASNSKIFLVFLFWEIALRYSDLQAIRKVIQISLLELNTIFSTTPTLQSRNTGWVRTYDRFNAAMLIRRHFSNLSNTEYLTEYNMEHISNLVYIMEHISVSTYQGVISHIHPLYHTIS